MSLTFEIKGPLPEHAIRHIIRETEACLADGVDPKAALVQTAQGYFTEQQSLSIRAEIDNANETAEMLGTEADIEGALAEVKAQIGAEFKTIMDALDGGPVQQLADALAKAQVMAKPVMPMNRGKFLAKLGIVKAHIDALVPATTKPAAEIDAETASTRPFGAGPHPGETLIVPPADDDALDLDAMLGLDVQGAAPVAPPPFESFAAACADIVGPPPQTSADAPSAAPPSPDAPPPPPATNLRDAFVLFGEALDVDDAALATALGVSRSTIHNYTSGKTSKVKVNLAQARRMVAEIDARAAKLRQAADIFAQVRD